MPPPDIWVPHRQFRLFVAMTELRGVVPHRIAMWTRDQLLPSVKVARRLFEEERVRQGDPDLADAVGAAIRLWAGDLVQSARDEAGWAV